MMLDPRKRLLVALTISLIVLLGNIVAVTSGNAVMIYAAIDPVINLYDY